MKPSDPSSNPPPAAPMLRATEERFRTLVQNVRDYAIFMLDANAVVTEWTEGAQRVTGYTAAEAVGKHLSIFYPPELVAAGEVEREIQEAAATGRAERETWRVRKGGVRFWANEIATAIRAPDGRLEGFTKIARDLSEKKRMQDALRESEERHRLLLESARDHAIFTTDAHALITSWNPGAQRIFGYRSDQILGVRADVLFTPEDRARGEHDKELAIALREGRASDDRWQMRGDGQRFWASGVTAPMFDDAGHHVGFTKVLRDLTEAKSIQEQRERLLASERVARREAERAVVIRDQFLSVVSHELRTPVSAILLWSRLLHGGAVPPQQQAAALEAIEQSALSQRQLIEDLLDMGQMMAGKLRVDQRELILTGVVGAAVEAVRPMAQARGVALEAALEEGAGPVVADPPRIQQVVWNLVNNAVKFTEAGGRVRVALARAGAAFRIEVADTGRGIAPEFLPHVFEMFRQEDASTTREHGGLGLGLAIARQLVELHGGTILARSPGIGRGSTFTVELPAAPASLPEPDRPPDPGAVLAPVLGETRILLVDDSPATLHVLQWLLEQCGAHVTAVSSAAAALQAHRDAAVPFDLLIADIGMPSRDGYHLIEELRAAERKHPGRRAIAAMALTAYTQEKDRQRAIEAGFDAHLSKPVEPTALIAEVTRLATARPNAAAPRPESAGTEQGG